MYANDDTTYHQITNELSDYQCQRNSFSSFHAGKPFKYSELDFSPGTYYLFINFWIKLIEKLSYVYLTFNFLILSQLVKNVWK